MYLVPLHLPNCRTTTPDVLLPTLEPALLVITNRLGAIRNLFTSHRLANCCLLIILTDHQQLSYQSWTSIDLTRPSPMMPMPHTNGYFCTIRPPWLSNDIIHLLVYTSFWAVVSRRHYTKESQILHASFPPVYTQFSIFYRIVWPQSVQTSFTQYRKTILQWTFDTFGNPDKFLWSLFPIFHCLQLQSAVFQVLQKPWRWSLLIFLMLIVFTHNATQRSQGFSRC